MPPTLKLLATVYGIVFVAELPDKTALAALVLATRHRALPVFLGSAAALAVQSLVAVAAGQLLTLLPARPVHIVAGLVFFVSAIVMWMRHEEATEAGPDDAKRGFWGSTWTVFAVVFIAEWGDLTQLATGALAARYAAPVAVFVAATAALDRRRDRRLRREPGGQAPLGFARAANRRRALRPHRRGPGRRRLLTAARRPARHSYRSASIGSSCDAFRAG